MFIGLLMLQQAIRGLTCLHKKNNLNKLACLSYWINMTFVKVFRNTTNDSVMKYTSIKFATLSILLQFIQIN